MKKKLAYFMTTSAMAIALTGCGATSSSSVSTSSASSSSSTESSVQVDELTATYNELMARTASNQVAIDMWHSFGPGPTPSLEAAVADFEELFPMIDVTLTSKGGYDNLKKAVTLEISTGNTPDVVIGYPDHFAEYIAGEIMVPLDSYIDSTNEDIGIDINDFHSYYMTENRQFEVGKTYGLPFNKSTEVFIYNKTFFDKHEIEVPTTWTEVQTAANAVLTTVRAVINQTPDGNGKKIDAVSGLDFTNVTVEDFYPMAYDSQANFFITMIRQWGGVYTEIGDSYEQGYIRFDSATTRTAMSFFQTMYTNHLFAPPQAWEEPSYASNPFKALKTLMGVSSSAGVYNNIAAAGEYDLGIAEVPYQSTENAAVIQQGTNIAMLSNSTTLERMASWMLIRYLTGEGNVDFAIGASYLPVRKSGVASATYQAFINNTTVSNDKDKSIIDSAKVASGYLADTNPVEWTAFTDPGFIGSTEVRDTVGLFFPGVTVGGKTIDAQLAEIVALLPYYIE